jgi:hypothetical protein
MFHILSVAVVVVSLTSPQDHKKVRAPQPKPQETPVIEGNYTLNYTIMTTGFDRGFGGGGPGGRMPVNQITLRASNASITKSEITIGGAAGAGWGYDPYSDAYYDPYEGRQVRNTTPAMSYVIDPSKTPMTIDVTTVNVRNKKEKSLGLIEVSDDRITITLGKPGAERPKNFDEGEEVTLYYFKKAKPVPVARDEYRIVTMTVGKEAEAEKELNKLAKEGFVLVNTTNPAANDAKSSPTTVHLVLKRTTRQP